jgi:exodeoxyribonuclease VII small subunit
MAQQRAFEELYRELEETVRRLESGDLPLADAVALFEQSTKLAEQCNVLLDEAELRVRQLTVGPEGELDTEPFDG